MQTAIIRTQSFRNFILLICIISAKIKNLYGYAGSPSDAYLTTKDTKGTKRKSKVMCFLFVILRVLRGEIISDGSNWRFPDNR
jgi:hypothetical protein